jgi:fatty acid desaturase
MPSHHRLVTSRVVIETLVLFVGLSYLAYTLGQNKTTTSLLLYSIVLFAQALLFQRLYIIGHEAAHRKLVLNNRNMNDLLGQALMLPILIPVQIYRKVHNFHHGFNRRDHHTSALDVFVSPWRVTPIVRVFYYLVWYVGVFAGGYFLHSVASIIIFLFVPTSKAVRVSPAFKNWKQKDRVRSWLEFLACVSFHLLVAFIFGYEVLLYSLGLPFLAFAWLWSLLVYIFHYHTTLGQQTRFNVRSLQQNWFFSWLLLNFNQHATHHMFPNVPWYKLLERHAELPKPYAQKNQTTSSVWGAILKQLSGPTIVYKKDPDPTPQLFVRWED